MAAPDTGDGYAGQPHPSAYQQPLPNAEMQQQPPGLPQPPARSLRDASGQHRQPPGPPGGFDPQAGRHHLRVPPGPAAGGFMPPPLRHMHQEQVNSPIHLYLPFIYLK